MATKPALLVVADFPFVRVGGRFYAETPWDEAWARLYRPTFGPILLLGRRRAAAAPPPGWIEIDPTRYEVIDGGDWHGPFGFLGNLPRLVSALRSLWDRTGALYLKLFYLNSVAVWVYNRFRGTAGKPVVTLLVGDSAEAVLLRDDVLPFGWMRRAAARLVAATLRAIQRRVEVAGFWARFLEQKFGTAGPRSLVVLEPWLHDAQIRVHDRRAPRPVPTLLFVGRLIQRKRAHLLLEALKQLTGDGVALNLVVVGDGPERGGLEALARDLGIAERVRFRGWLGLASPQALEAYDSADILCLPSFAEGLPLVILEAMGRGVAVVATAVSGTPEAVVNEQTGLLVPRDDVPALTSAIRRMVSDAALWRRCVEGGYQVARRYTFEAQRRQLAEATKELLG